VLIPGSLPVGRRSLGACVPCMRSCSGVHVSGPGKRGAEGQGKGRCAPCADAVAPRAQGRPREVGSEGRGERTCGTRDTNRIPGVAQSGRAGTQQHSPPSTSGRCFLPPASMPRRDARVPREASPVPRAVACHGKRLRVASAALPPGEESAKGRGGPLCGPQAGPGGRRRTGGWTAAPHLTSRAYGPGRRKGGKPRVEYREHALQWPTRH
jgi:hypothetical protein